LSDKAFLYQQYNELDWPQQEKTNMNGFINAFIINQIIFAKQSLKIKIFDIGFGIGAFIRMMIEKTKENTELFIEGCEPSEKNYHYFSNALLPLRAGIRLKIHPNTFLQTQTEERFDFITAIYVFPHIVKEELSVTAKKIHAILEPGGSFIMVVANEKYLKEKIHTGRSAYTLLQQTQIEYDGKKYVEYLHYTDLPGIGRILDYSREENFYIDVFRKNGLCLVQKNDLEDSGYVCSVFEFRKTEVK
jgi:2-polyprenyl-3-methyl-5-hydroxy-6-metoxy-1,4-benzoquinol methylase